ncbi:MAG: hypothetical protein JST83_05430 [Bacteroidetes bacterium]|nr:hypothetical protein [Bacteroidota bacterium]
MKRDTAVPSLRVRLPVWMPSAEKMTKGTHLVPDRLRAITHQIFLSWVKYKRIQKESAGSKGELVDCFAVYSELLKEIGSENYAAYIRLLETHNIVERVRNDDGQLSYATGGHSARFRWAKPVGRTKLSFRFEVITDHRTIKSILRSRDRHATVAVKIPDVIEANREVFEQLRQFTGQAVFLSSDFETVSHAIKPLFSEQVMNGSLSWHSVCSFGNRYHTQFTSLPKEFRQYIRFKDDMDAVPIMLDFANSQPYFSSIIAGNDLIEKLAPEFLPLKPLISNCCSASDFLHYKALCATGKLYDHFTTASTLSRQDVKDYLFKAVLFAKKSVRGKDFIFRRDFQKVFPSVVAMADAIRNLDEHDLPLLKDIIRPANVKFKSRYSNHSHKILPALMQRLESRIIYRYIVPDMIAAGLGPFITIHDAFIILPSHEQEARNIISTCFERFGVQPPVIRTEAMSLTTV